MQQLNGSADVGKQAAANIESTMPHYKHQSGPALVLTGALTGAATNSFAFVAGETFATEADQATAKKKFKEAISLVRAASPVSVLYLVFKVADIEAIMAGNPPAVLMMAVASESVAKVACAPGGEYVCTPLMD